VAWVEGVSVLGGEGHITSPHDSTQGRDEQRCTITPTFFVQHIEHNCTFNGSDGTHCTPGPLLSRTILKNKYISKYNYH
jgi:hypothetical protein